MRRLVLKLALVMVVGLLPVVATASQAAAAGDPASDFVARINALRTSKGLRPLAPNGPLTSFAAGWTAHMAQTGTLAHNPALPSAPGRWTVVGENVGVGANVDQLFQAFVNSPHHYENLVDPRFDSIGVSVTVDGSGRMWTTHDFEAHGTPAAAVRPPAPAPAPAAKPTPSPKPAPRPAAPPVTTAPRAKAAAPAAAASPAPPTPPVTAAPPPPAPAPAPAPVPDAPVRIKLSLELLRGATPSL